jgi:hypothetical protein
VVVGFELMLARQALYHLSQSTSQLGFLVVDFFKQNL